MEWTKKNITKMTATTTNFTDGEGYYISLLIYENTEPQPFEKFDFSSWDGFLRYLRIAKLELKKNNNLTQCIIL